MLQNSPKTSCGVLFFTRSGSDLSKFIHLYCSKIRTAVGLRITKKAAGQAGDFLFISGLIKYKVLTAQKCFVFTTSHKNCKETKGKIESQCIFCFDMYTNMLYKDRRLDSESSE